MAFAQPQRQGTAGRIGGPNFPRSMRWWSLTQWLIAVNVAIFLLDAVTRGELTSLGNFSATRAIYRGQLWRWITYAFLHHDPYHLLFNMLALWAFGPIVEAHLQRGRYFAFYLLGGLGGAVAYVLLWRMNLLHVGQSTTLVGASACIFGVLIGAAHVAPERIYRFYFAVELKLRTIAWIAIGLAVYVVATSGENAGGEAAHLGGAVAGLVLIRNVGWFNRFRIGPRKRRFWRPGDPAENFFRRD